MFEWFFENWKVIIGIVLSIIGFALWAYQYAAIKYNIINFFGIVREIDENSNSG